MIPTGFKKWSALKHMLVVSVLNESRGNMTKAAKTLGIGRATLYRYVTKHQIDFRKMRK